MNITKFVLAGILLAGISPLAMAADPAANGQVVLTFAGGSVWTSNSGGTCLWYFPTLGNLDITALFQDGKTDVQHAYLLWVSDWSIKALVTQGQLPPHSQPNPSFGWSLAVIPQGDATVYFSNNPTGRNLTQVTDRRTWGVPIAKFVRGGGLFQSPDGFMSDKFFFSAFLQWSTPFGDTNRRPFSLGDLIPYGMTCFEFGLNSSTMETGTCVAMGAAR
ncbi:MAG TPA: hypothetical protein VFA04_01645 [Bryobacteraceae bacterium]|nr:hypothetical protein [Bryobacteraceae bacterium]